jgi:hypothetical protein
VQRGRGERGLLRTSVEDSTFGGPGAEGTSSCVDLTSTCPCGLGPTALLACRQGTQVQDVNEVKKSAHMVRGMNQRVNDGDGDLVKAACRHWHEQDEHWRCACSAGGL